MKKPYTSFVALEALSGLIPLLDPSTDSQHKTQYTLTHLESVTASFYSSEIKFTQILETWFQLLPNSIQALTNEMTNFVAEFLQNGMLEIFTEHKLYVCTCIIHKHIQSWKNTKRKATFTLISRKWWAGGNIVQVLKPSINLQLSTRISSCIRTTLQAILARSLFWSFITKRKSRKVSLVNLLKASIYTVQQGIEKLPVLQVQYIYGISGRLIKFSHYLLLMKAKQARDQH